MRSLALLLLAASVLNAEKAEILKLTDDLEAAIERADWRRASELSRALNVSVKQARNESLAREGRALADSILTWLPTDTETFVVAAQPFTLNARDDRKPQAALAMAQGYTMMLLAGAENQALFKGLAGRTVQMAALAGRRFGERPQDPPPQGTPAPLGMIPYQGCGVYQLTEPVSESVLNRPPDDTILGHRVWTSKGTLNDAPDSAKFFFSFLKPNLILTCNHREFFTDMVTRMTAPSAGRALPDTLEEWKLVDRAAPLWAISHYGNNAGLITMLTGDATGAKAEGIAVEFGRDGEGAHARMISPVDPWAQLLTSPDMRGAAKTRQDPKGVWELTIDGRLEAAGFAALVLMGALGFVVLI